MVLEVQDQDWVTLLVLPRIRIEVVEHGVWAEEESHGELGSRERAELTEAFITNPLTKTSFRGHAPNDPRTFP